MYVFRSHAYTIDPPHSFLQKEKDYKFRVNDDDCSLKIVADSIHNCKAAAATGITVTSGGDPWSVRVQNSRRGNYTVCCGEIPIHAANGARFLTVSDEFDIETKPTFFRNQNKWAANAGDKKTISVQGIKLNQLAQSSKGMLTTAKKCPPLSNSFETPPELVYPLSSTQFSLQYSAESPGQLVCSTGFSNRIALQHCNVHCKDPSVVSESICKQFCETPCPVKRQNASQGSQIVQIDNCRLHYNSQYIVSCSLAGDGSSEVPGDEYHVPVELPTTNNLHESPSLAERFTSSGLSVLFKAEKVGTFLKLNQRFCRSV